MNENFTSLIAKKHFFNFFFRATIVRYRNSTLMTRGLRLEPALCCIKPVLLVLTLLIGLTLDSRAIGTPPHDPGAKKAVSVINSKTKNPLTVSRHRTGYRTDNNNTLDVLGLTASTPAATAYSMRLLNSSYSGPLARITTDGGNTYYDVYPDASADKKFSPTSPISGPLGYNDVFAAATSNTLSSIINGSTTASVGIWYDQSINKNDANQNQAERQPFIITDGVIHTEGGKPAIRFKATGFDWLTSVANVTIAGASSISAVAQNVHTEAQSGSPCIVTQTANNLAVILGQARTETMFYGTIGDQGYSTIQADNLPYPTTPFVATGTYGNTNLNLFVNGVMVATRNDANANVNGSSPIRIARRWDLGDFFDGYIPEVIVFPSELTSGQRKMIEGNQFTYYGIGAPSAPAAETITFNALSAKTYGDIDSAPGATSTNAAIAITYKSDNAGVATIVNGNIHIVGAGSANITASQTADSAHTAAADVIQPLIVNHAALTITANNQTKAYGAPLPALTAAYTGFVNGDTETSLTTLPILTTTATSSSHVSNSPYVITAAGAISDNYTISYTDGSIAVTQVPLKVVADDKGMAYGADLPELTSHFVGLVNGDTGFSLNSTGNLSTTATPSSLPGSYPITISGVNASDYLINYTSGTLIVRPSAVASLSGIIVSSGSLSFNSGTSTYTLPVNNATTSITLTSTVSDANATITVNGSTVASGSASDAILLAVGSNVITTTVTAQNGTTKQSYTVTVIRALSGNANLSGLTESSGTLSPVFDASTLNYKMMVANTRTFINLTPTAADNLATIEVNGIVTPSGTSSPQIILTVGDNVVNTIVTAQDGTKKSYLLTVTRSLPNNANLAGVSISTGSLSPTFSASTSSYSSQVANSVLSLTVTPKLSDSLATVKVNGVAVNSGSASGAIPLVAGPNAISVVVTAQDGTVKTYKITIFRTPSSNADLAALTTNTVPINPVFNAATLIYRAVVLYTSSQIKITPTVADKTAIIKVNGVPSTSGTPTSAITLLVGDNFITTAVTAQNGDIKIYQLIITRSLPADANLSGLSLSNGILGPAFASSIQAYTASVSNATASISITPTASDPTASIKVNEILTTSGAASANIPLALSAPTSIKIAVTAQNGTVKTYQVMVTRVSNNANLTNLVLSNGVLSPAFATPNQIYTASVSNATTSISITPTTSSTVATVKVNGTAIVSGAASAAIPLVVGTNVVKTAVTAQDGTFKTYIVTISRALSSNADLAAMTLSTGALSPVFDAATLNYKATVAYTTIGINLTALTADNTAFISVNGIPCKSGVSAPKILLTVGDNVIITKVTAEDGSTVKIYQLTVTRSLPADANLVNLSLSNGGLSPAFTAAISSYDSSVANSVTSVNVTPVLSDPRATVTVNGLKVAVGSASTSIRLVGGLNTIYVVVAAQNGVLKTYKINITRAKSSNADLVAFNFSDSHGAILSPGFNAGIYNYNANVSYKTTSLALQPTVADSTATITFNGTKVASGSRIIQKLNLPLGDTVITTTVTAEDGITVKKYLVTVTQELSPENRLGNLSINNGSFSPYFSPANSTYDRFVANSVSTIRVTPVSADARATVTVNKIKVVSGSASADIPLAFGLNTIDIQVTAQTGAYRDYHINVTRANSSNANLAALVISSGTLNKVFNADTLNYYATVTNATSSIIFTPTVADNTAIIKVNGVPNTSGVPTSAFTLLVGNNLIITTVVTAQNGDTKTYKLTVTRPPSANANLLDLSLSNGILSPAFVSSTQNYNTTVSNATASIIITPTASDPSASIKVNGILTTSGAASADIPLALSAPTSINVVVTAQNGTVKTYQVMVTRLSNNANLTNLTLSKGVLSPAFATQTQNYTASVSNATPFFTLTPTTYSPVATVKVNAMFSIVVVPGAASAPIPLVVGTNVIKTVVTAQDGTIKTYTITVTRALPSLNSIYTPGANSSATPLIASLTNEKVVANNILSPNGDGVNDIWIVRNLAFYPENTVSVYDRSGNVVFSKKNYANDWAGTYRGGMLAEGTYYYLIDLGKGKIIKGYITVVR